MIRIEECTGLILAGGKSSRMGQNKALLQLNGKTLLQWQVEKFQQLGAKEILISGPKQLSLPGVRTVADVYPGCGPISGLHAGLAAASCSHCCVISVDLPLVTGEIMRSICAAHNSGVTILRHFGGEEPLLGVYDRAVAPLLEQMIHQGIYTVRALEQNYPVQRWDYCGPEELLCNCNRPEDFVRVEQSFT